MAEDKWFRASVAVWGKTLQPDAISAALGIKPTRARILGEARSAGSQLHWKDSLWMLESPLSETCDPVEHLTWLLELLEPKASILKDIAGEYRVELFCGFASENGQGGFTLSVELLGRLAHLGIPVTLDLYPPEASRCSRCPRHGT